MAERPGSGSSSMGGHSPADITHSLKGVQFPARRDDLVKLAERNGAGDDVKQMLQRLPDDEYGTIAEVMHGVKEANR